MTKNWSIPMTWFQSLNPLIVFLFTPLILAHWMRVARKTGKQGSSIIKMAIGASLVRPRRLLTGRTRRGLFLQRSLR